jgi:hypothetical protein
MIPQNSADWIQCRIRINVQCKVIDNFETFPESTNTPSYDQRFMSYGHWNLEKVSVLDRSNCLANF